MKQIIALAVCAAALPGLAAAEVAPHEVPFQDFAVNVSLTGVPGDPAEGRKVLASRALGNCVACHQNSDMADVPFQGDVGPSLDYAGERWTEGELRALIVNAKLVFDGTVMPAFYKASGFIRPGEAFTMKPAAEPLPTLLTAQQVEDVVAYLMTLKE